MYIKNLAFILLISTIISCKHQSQNHSQEASVLAFADSLNILNQKDIYLIFISPNSRCLLCDKKMYEISEKLSSQKKLYLISTFEKDRLFSSADSKNLFEIPEEQYYRTFSHKFSEFSRLVIIKDAEVQNILLITAQNSDTIVNFLNKNITL